MRMVKHAKPAMKHMEKILGQDGVSPGIQILKQQANEAFLAASEEEVKNDEAAMAKKVTEISVKVDKIFSQLEEKKKVVRPTNFKNFMRT